MELRIETMKKTAKKQLRTPGNTDKEVRKKTAEIVEAYVEVTARAGKDRRDRESIIEYLDGIAETVIIGKDHFLLRAVTQRMVFDRQKLLEIIPPKDLRKFQKSVKVTEYLIKEKNPLAKLIG